MDPSFSLGNSEFSTLSSFFGTTSKIPADNELAAALAKIQAGNFEANESGWTYL